MTRLCSRLAQKLKEEHRFKDAAAIFFEYLDSAEDAADALVQGQVWTEARRVIARSGREDLFGNGKLPVNAALFVVDFQRMTFQRLTLFPECEVTGNH